MTITNNYKMTLNSPVPDSAPSSQATQLATAPTAGPQPAVQLKYAVQIKDITKCPSKKLKVEIGIAYRFAFDNLADPRNFLPIALIQPERMVPVPPGVKKPVKECCEAWSLSMYTTLDALQDRARKALETSPLFLKRVGSCFTQIKITPGCGAHTEPNHQDHFEFFERESFDGMKAVIHHGKMAL